jgi:hypothetical protein
LKEWLGILKQFLTWIMRPQQSIPLRAPSGKSKQELFYEVMAQRLEAQSRADDALSQKTATWLTIPTLVLTFLATILVVERDSLSQRDYIVVLAAFVLYIVSLFFLYLAYRPKVWLAGPFWQELAMIVGDQSHTVDDMYYEVRAYAFSLWHSLDPDLLSHGATFWVSPWRRSQGATRNFKRESLCMCRESENA